MDSFELNKILGAVLGTCLALLSLNIAAGAIFSTPCAGKAGLRGRGPGRGQARRAGAGRAAADEPLPVRFASADVGRGENSAKKCAACHTFGKGEPNRVGPNLYGVVGRAEGVGGRLQLFGGDEGPEGQLDAGGPRHVPDQSEGLWFPAPP